MISKIKRGAKEMVGSKIAVILLIVALAATLFFILEINGVTDLLTGNVAITTSFLNESSQAEENPGIGKISVIMIFLGLIVALAIFLGYLNSRKSNEDSE